MARAPELIRTVREMRHWRSQRDGVVGFVPTMGALHRGHAHLLRELRPVCESSVLSIFVNPTQFGPQEDLAKYPRTFDEDMQMAQAEGVNAVFYPDPKEIYPEGFSTFVEETALSQPLCGRFRPGHFRGVATVVLKLFQIVQPNVALFGLKDAQQFFVIEKMVRDLNIPVRLGGVPTVRDGDGLALSSRNKYLSPDERKKAPLLYQVLRLAEKRILAGEDRESVLREGRHDLESSGWRVQYLDFVELPGQIDVRRSLIAAAAYLGETRLIDNVILESKL